MVGTPSREAPGGGCRCPEEPSDGGKSYNTDTGQREVQSSARAGGRKDTLGTVMQIVKAIKTDGDFHVMSTTKRLTSMFWDPSFTLGDCRMDMTDCQD